MLGDSRSHLSVDTRLPSLVIARPLHGNSSLALADLNFSGAGRISVETTQIYSLQNVPIRLKRQNLC